jgi:hypothetical protein
METDFYCIFFAANSPVHSEPDVNPCEPTPCGPNAQCKSINGQPDCSCLPEMTGSPPNCRPECVIDSDCPSEKACIRSKCQDPCQFACGENADCNIINHIPICTCPQGYDGNPFIACLNFNSGIKTSNPCDANPCDTSDCIVNSDCPANKACANGKCKDPCAGVCGVNADCKIVHHNPICICSKGFVGDPFGECSTSNSANA